jgi:hypothetical protein
VMVAAMSGCASDPCITACGDVARAIDACRVTWGTTWEDFGAESRAAYRTACENDWNSTRADLEVRQITDAEDQCQAAVDELADADCDELRALYLF